LNTYEITFQFSGQCSPLNSALWLACKEMPMIQQDKIKKIAFDQGADLFGVASIDRLAT